MRHALSDLASAVNQLVSAIIGENLRLKNLNVLRFALCAMRFALCGALGRFFPFSQLEEDLVHPLQSVGEVPQSREPRLLVKGGELCDQPALFFLHCLTEFVWGIPGFFSKALSSEEVQETPITL